MFALVAFALLFAAVATYVVKSVRETRNRDYVQSLTSVMLLNAERQMDLIAGSIAGLPRDSEVVCAGTIPANSPVSVRHILSVDATGRTLCAIDSSSAMAAPMTINLNGGLISHDGAVSLIAFPTREGTSLGIVRMDDGAAKTIAIVDPETVLTGALSNRLPAISENRLVLNDGVELASRVTGTAKATYNDVQDLHPVAFQAASSRYPFRAEISLDSGALIRMSPVEGWLYFIANGVIGMLLGWLVLRVVQASRNIGQSAGVQDAKSFA